MKEIYLDNAATTRIDPEVLKAMMPFLGERYGNPSSMHDKGMEARSAVEKARESVGRILNCRPDEIIFTGSGTESDNMAIFGYARKNRKKGKHIITTSIEHHAVLDVFHKLGEEGFDITILDVDMEGIVHPETLKSAMRNDTILVSVIYANNEIGTVQDIKELARITHEGGAVFHTDACQAANYLSTDVKELDVDMMTLNGSKIYGPKGIGMLYKRKDIMIEPIIFGGGQEQKLRSGTENVANIVGFAKALEMVSKGKQEEIAHSEVLRDRLIKGLLTIHDTRLNGHPVKRLPNNVNISFLNVEGESLLLLLNEESIYASTGSACSSDSLEPSHVIVALGLPLELGHSSIRFSLGKETAGEDITHVLQTVPPIVARLRAMSPLKRTMDEILGGKTTSESGKKKQRSS